MNPYLVAAIAVGVAAGGGYMKGRVDGRSLEAAAQISATAALQAELDAAAENLNRVNAALFAARQARELIALEIEDEARADPASVGRIPSPDSLRRLKARWGAASGP